MNVEPLSIAPILTAAGALALDPDAALVVYCGGPA